MINTCALIPLRGGSKSIPGKNIKPIGGKPLCYWVLKAAHESRTIDKVFVSTDSEEIIRVVESFKLGTGIIRRPEALATDTASTESVMLHFSEQVACQVLILIQATSPLLTSSDLDSAYSQFISEGCDSMLSGVLSKRFYWSLDGKPLNYDPRQRPMRQNFSGTFVENGAFYIVRQNILKKHKCRLGGKTGLYIMDPETEVEIDEPEDWHKLEKLILKKHAARNTGKVKLLVCDVDGTLTDGGMYYSSEGEQLKKFNTRDARGLQFIQEQGIDVLILTTENSPIAASRAKKLGIKDCYVGITDKLQKLKEIAKSRNIDLCEIAYIGDDNNDLECMKICGLTGCPKDAHPSIKEICRFTSQHRGGQGAVREFCDYIMALEKK